MKLLTAEQMRETDRRAIEEIGLSGLVLMEQAGRGTSDLLRERFARLFPGPVLVLAGKGNNGGDGFVVARHLLNAGWQVRTLVLGERERLSGDARTNLEVLLKIGAEVAFVPAEERLAGELEKQGDCLLIVDALFGTGLSSPLAGAAKRAVEWINGSRAQVVAVDMPSGIDATCGAVLGSAVRAQMTVTFGFAKLGQFLYPGAAHVGELRVVDIGLPALLNPSLDQAASLESFESAAGLVPERPRQGHKGRFGHLLVVAGSRGKTGAAVLCAEAGLRGGAGLVTLAGPAAEQPVLAARLTEVMTEPLADHEGHLSLPALEVITRLAEGKQALALGPGLGTADETVELVQRLVVSVPLPLVVDADGLNALAQRPEVLRERPGPPAILTPHPGEMARLTGLSVAEIEANRPQVAGEFARRFGVVLVLKGAGTVTALPDGRLFINSSGNPGLASGGMGDVLTGLVGSLLAQGLAAAEAARLAVFWHGFAADRLARTLGTAGLLAGDLLREIPSARLALSPKEASGC